jgi:cysteine desulfurase/selenocysteine lyase
MKKKFPFFKEHPYVHYFDSAATTLKPQVVIDAMAEAYTKYTIPIEKAVYKIAENYYEEVIISLKSRLKKLFNADTHDIFFGHSVTSLLHQILELSIHTLLKEKNEIRVLLPETVHNSFFILLQKYKNIKMYSYTNLNFNEFLNDYIFDIIYIPTIDHINGAESNYIKLIEYKKKHEVIVIADASQSGMYQNEDLSSCLFDFFLLSSHKMYGPEGLAVLMVAKELLHKKNSITTLTPYFLRNFFAQGSLPYTTFYGFLIALEFLEKHIYYDEGYKKKQSDCINTIYNELLSNKNVVLLSPINTKTIITFYHSDIHAHDVAIAFSNHNICVRSGDLCSHFIFENNKNGLVRISLGCYIEKTDVELIKKVILSV